MRTLHPDAGGGTYGEPRLETLGAARLRSLGPRDFIDVDANLDGHVSASELRTALVEIDEKHADPVPLENYGDALHEFDFDSDKRLSIYEWRYVPWPRRAYHSDEGHERG